LNVRTPDGSIGQIELNQDNKSDFDYFLEEELRPGQLYPIEEDSSGSYILNSRDLCLMPKLGEYLASGLDSLKVEGRNKSAYYVAVVGRAYRLAIDAYHRDPLHFDPEPFMAELATVASRGYTLGFHSGRMDATGQDLEGRQSLSDYEFAGVVREHIDDGLVLEVRNRLRSGDVLEFLSAGRLEGVRLRLYDFENAVTGERLDKISGGERRAIRIAWSAFHCEDLGVLKRDLVPLTVVRKAKKLTTEETEQLERNRITQQAEISAASASTSSPPLSMKPKSTPAKPPRLGADGCCGLGCNGCLPFWNDEKYADAREKLRLSRGGKLRKVTDLSK
jgi:putative protease